MQDSKDHADIKALHGDSTCVFSDMVKKYSRSLKPLQKAVLITEKAIYHMDRFPKPKNGKQFAIKRRTDLSQVEGVTVSPFTDNIVVIHIPSVVDYVFELPKKNVLVAVLVETMKKSHNKKLNLSFKANIPWKSASGPKGLSAAEGNKSGKEEVTVVTKRGNDLVVLADSK